MDGTIAFVGRKDNQIKIRGYRIEPGEIESVLSAHPAVRESVVVAHGNKSEDKRLVAYAVLDHDATCTVSELHSFLKSKLPHYLIPSAFVLLDTIPFTPNGKVDHRALPTPHQTRADMVAPVVTPRTQVEALLAGIWAEVLELEKVGIHDDFFELGGHSLLATQVVSRAREAFRADLPLRALFENPSVAALAVKIAEIQAQKVGPRDTEDALADVESLSDEEAEHPLVSERTLKEI